MGDARRRELATAVAQQHVQAKALGPREMMVCLQVDLACHVLVGQAMQLAQAVGAVEAATEFKKAIDFLQGYKARFLAAQETKLVIAQPGDVPPPPPGLVRP